MANWIDSYVLADSDGNGTVPTLSLDRPSDADDAAQKINSVAATFSWQHLVIRCNSIIREGRH